MKSPGGCVRPLPARDLGQGGAAAGRGGAAARRGGDHFSIFFSSATWTLSNCGDLTSAPPAVGFVASGSRVV